VIFCIIARYILQPEDFSSGFFICLYRLHGDVINGIISFVFSSLIHYFSTLGKLGYVHKRMLKMVVMENPGVLLKKIVPQTRFFCYPKVSLQKES